LIVRYRAAAKADLDEIWLYIAQDSQIAADRVIDRIEEAVRRLDQFPNLGIARADLAEGLRALRVDNLIVFYTPQGTVLMIERVLHARLDISSAQF
jgi:toxin ParE1/3/4